VIDLQHAWTAGALAAGVLCAADLGGLVDRTRGGKGASVPADLHAVLREVTPLLHRCVDKRIRIDLRLDAPSAWTAGKAAPRRRANAARRRGSAVRPAVGES
jgi:hypothetical protein